MVIIGLVVYPFFNYDDFNIVNSFTFNNVSNPIIWGLIYLIMEYREIEEKIHKNIFAPMIHKLNWSL